jgi:hypothetical protein
VVAFVAVAVLVMSALTIGRPSFLFVASSQNEVTPANLQAIPPAENQSAEETVEANPPATPLPREELVAAEPTPQPTRRPGSNQPIVANEPAETLFYALIEAGLQNDEDQLRFLLNRSRPFSAAGLRVWQRLVWCQGQFTAGDLRLHTVTPQPRLTSIYVYHGRQFLGDMKFYLDDNGDWYLAYLNYGSFSQRSAGCVPQ